MEMSNEYRETGRSGRTGTNPGRETREHAGEFKDEVLRNGRRVINQSKDTAADVIIDFADALGSAAGELDRKNRKDSAEYLRSASRLAREFSSTLREQDMSELVDQAASYGKRQPLLFLGGAVIAGFAVTRLLQSGNKHKEEADRQEHRVKPTELSAEYRWESPVTTPPETQTSDPLPEELNTGAAAHLGGQASDNPTPPVPEGSTVSDKSPGNR